jgi:hypothetical protein
LSPDETISSFVWHKVSTTTAIQEEIHCLDPQITTGTSPGIQIFPDYRLPISWLVFLLELLIGHVRRKAQIAAYATFCNIDQPSFGGGVPGALS